MSRFKLLMLTTLVTVFVHTYTAIAFEQQLQANKSASAILSSGFLLIIYALMGGGIHKPFKISMNPWQKLHKSFFLMGATMTIVEAVDAHNGFTVLTSRIRTKRLHSLPAVPVPAAPSW